MLCCRDTGKWFSSLACPDGEVSAFVTLSFQRSSVKFTLSGTALCLLAAGALVLSACGGNTNTSSGASARVNCGGKKELKAAGSTAQENAIARADTTRGRRRGAVERAACRANP